MYNIERWIEEETKHAIDIDIMLSALIQGQNTHKLGRECNYHEAEVIQYSNHYPVSYNTDWTEMGFIVFLSCRKWKGCLNVEMTIIDKKVSISLHAGLYKLIIKTLVMTC